jgi:phosphatidylglycerol:prolipoprotein diacylglycerol transferase
MKPVLHLGELQLPAFGVMLALGLAAVHILLSIQARRYAYSFSRLHSITLVAFVGGSIGSRLFNMLLVDRDFLLPAIGQLSEGTFFYGFLIGLLLACSIYYHYFSSADPWDELDLAVPAWLALYVAGRIGCFLAGCCYGTPTDLPWGVTYHAELSQAPHGVTLHPTQLYEALAVLLLLCYTVTRRAKPFAGALFLRTIALYGVTRFFLEFLRDDDRGTLCGGAVSTSQGISLVFVTAALLLLRRGRAASRSALRPVQPVTINTTHKTHTRRSL